MYTHSFGANQAIKKAAENRSKLSQEKRNTLDKDLWILVLDPSKMDLKKIESLLTQGADPNAVGTGAYSVLHVLARGDSKIPYSYEQYLDIIGSLIRYGANINLVNNYGNTPLIMAVVASNYDLARALMHYNADPFIKNHFNQTALSTVEFGLSCLTGQIGHGPHAEELNKAIQEKEKFKQELQEYIKNYREKHRKEIREGTFTTLPAEPLSGLITDILLGGKEQD